MPDEYIHLGPGESILDGDTLPDTVAPDGDTSYGGEGIEKEDRFAVTPLYTRYNEYALDGEYMVDKNTGAPAIKRENGTVVCIHEISRLKEHLERMTEGLCYLGLRNTSIYNMMYNDESEVTVYNRTNMLDEPAIVTTEDLVSKIVISVDLSILEKFDNDMFLHQTGIDPEIYMSYRLGPGIDEETVHFRMSELALNPLIVGNTLYFELTRIWCPEIDNNPQYETFIHSVLIAY